MVMFGRSGSIGSRFQKKHPFLVVTQRVGKFAIRFQDSVLECGQELVGLLELTIGGNQALRMFLHRGFGRKKTSAQPTWHVFGV